MDDGTRNVVARIRHAYHERYGAECTASDQVIANDWRLCKEQLQIGYLTQGAEDAMLIVLHHGL